MLVLASPHSSSWGGVLLACCSEALLRGLLDAAAWLGPGNSALLVCEPPPALDLATSGPPAATARRGSFLDRKALWGRLRAELVPAWPPLVVEGWLSAPLEDEAPLHRTMAGEHGEGLRCWGHALTQLTAAGWAQLCSLALCSTCRGVHTCTGKSGMLAKLAKEQLGGLEGEGVEGPGGDSRQLCELCCAPGRLVLTDCLPRICSLMTPSVSGGTASDANTGVHSRAGCLCIMQLHLGLQHASSPPAPLPVSLLGLRRGVCPGYALQSTHPAARRAPGGRQPWRFAAGSPLCRPCRRQCQAHCIRAQQAVQSLSQPHSTPAWQVCPRRGAVPICWRWQAFERQVVVGSHTQREGGLSLSLCHEQAEALRYVGCQHATLVPACCQGALDRLVVLALRNIICRRTMWL